MAKPRKSFTLWIVGSALRYLFGLAILVMVLFLLWRVYFSGNPPDSMECLAPNDALAATYAAEGKSPVLYTQTQPSVTKEERNYGYFGVPRFVFIPGAEQLQVVFRYNNSTLEAVQRDLGLAEEPPKGVEIFDVTLILRRDLTPEDEKDNADDSPTISRERIAPSAVSVDTTSLYTYFLYTFDGVNITEDTLVAYLDIYYGTEPDYSSENLGSLRLYHRDDPRVEVKLSRKEKKALESYLAQK